MLNISVMSKLIEGLKKSLEEFDESNPRYKDIHPRIAFARYEAMKETLKKLEEQLQEATSSNQTNAQVGQQKCTNPERCQ
jgi:NAD-dependent DNA ligase